MCEPGTQEAESGQVRVQGHPGLHSKTPPLPIQKRGIRTYTVVPNETILKTTLPLWCHFTDISLLLERATEQGRAQRCGFAVFSSLSGATRTYSNVSASLTSLLEGKLGSQGSANIKAALGLQCLLALHICQRITSKSMPQTHETCSPCYRSPEDISGLLSIDLFTPSASRLHPLPLLQHALKFQSLLDFPFTFPSIHLPK